MGKNISSFFIEESSEKNELEIAQKVDKVEKEHLIGTQSYETFTFVAH
jgi:hypothetical protein